MDFDRGWRQRRAAAQHRAAVSKHGTSSYREYAERQRENQRRILRGEAPLPEQHCETAEEAKARRERDAIMLPTTIDDLEAEIEAAMNIPKRELN